MKHEWRKKEKEIYLPKAKPTYLKVPSFKYITIHGEGNPNSDMFANYVQTLYSLAYGIRMSYKWDTPPSNYMEYTVYPLEGVWDLIDPSKYNPEAFDKDNLKYEIMIRQPDFVDLELYTKVLEIVKKKKANPLLDQVEFKEIEDGPCVQMLHLGSYESEPASFKEMENFATDNNMTRLFKTHREIYLSDPRKTAVDKLKTVLRFKVKQH